jgi:hypothetical protein
MKGASYLATDYAVSFSHLSLSPLCGQVSPSPPCLHSTCILVGVTEVSIIFHRFTLRKPHSDNGDLCPSSGGKMEGENLPL